MGVWRTGMTAESLGWKIFGGGGKPQWCEGDDRPHLTFCSSLNFNKSNGFSATNRNSVLSLNARDFYSD